MYIYIYIRRQDKLKITHNKKLETGLKTTQNLMVKSNSHNKFCTYKLTNNKEKRNKNKKKTVMLVIVTLPNLLIDNCF